LGIEFPRLHHKRTQEQRIRLISRSRLLPVRDGSFYPVTDAVKVAEVLIESIFNVHVLPKIIISDSDDPKFTSKFWKSLETELRFSTAFHPDLDGETERLNQTLEIMLRHYVEYHLNTWTKYLPILEFVYNTARHSATGKSPFSLVYGENLIHPYLLSLVALNHKFTLQRPCSYL